MKQPCLTKRRVCGLKAEAIYIMREAVAEFAKPVTLYSIGKDSTVMLVCWSWHRRRSFPGRCDISPIACHSPIRTQVMKTEALCQR